MTPEVADLTYHMDNEYFLTNFASNYNELHVTFLRRDENELIFERKDTSNSGEEEEGDEVRVPIANIVIGDYDENHIAEHPEEWFIANDQDSNNGRTMESHISTQSRRSRDYSTNGSSNNGMSTNSSMYGGRRYKKYRKYKKTKKIRRGHLRKTRKRS